MLGSLLLAGVLCSGAPAGPENAAREDLAPSAPAAAVPDDGFDEAVRAAAVGACLCTGTGCCLAGSGVGQLALVTAGFTALAVGAALQQLAVVAAGAALLVGSVLLPVPVLTVGGGLAALCYTLGVSSLRRTASAAVTPPPVPAPPPLLPPDGPWHWDLPSPTGAHFRALHGAAGGNLWAVGDHGTLALRDGRRWRLARSPVQEHMLGVFVPSAVEAWAVGGHGTILHFLDNQWAALPPQGEQALRGVSGDGMRLWAVGDGGTIRHFNGAHWKDEVSTVRADLHAVWALHGMADVFAVGDGVILRRLGTWRREAVDGLGTLVAVSGTSAHDVWAAEAGGVVWHHDGNSWQRLDPGLPQGIVAMAVAGKDNVMLAGPTPPMRAWDGKQWSDLPVAAPANALWPSPDGKVFAAGPHGVLAVVDDGMWIPQSSLPSSQDAVFRLLGSAHGVLGATRLGVLSLQDEGHGVFPTTALLQDVTTAPDANVWSLDVAGQVCRLTTSPMCEPTNLPPVPGASLAVDEPRAVIVGDRGRVLVRGEQGWEAMASPTTEDLLATAITPTDAWAVGTGGTVLHLRDGTWKVEDLGTTATLRSVFASPSGEAWVVGDGGTVFHHDGARWRREQAMPPVEEDLRAVHGTSSGGVWMVGGRGVLLQWDGLALRHVPVPSQAPLRTVFVDGSAVYVAGGGVVMHRDF